MEKEQRPNTYVSPTVRCTEQWYEVLHDDDLTSRFDELVAITQNSVDANEHHWVADRQEVAGRWQHLVEMLGGAAISHGHPLLRPGTWMDQARVEAVLEPINFRSLDASFVENALILTHSLATNDSVGPDAGLVVRLNTINNVRDAKDPELAQYFTKRFDLRDMAEPHDSVLGTMTYETFATLSDDDRNAIAQRF